MEAIRLERPGVLERVEVAAPPPPGPGEALVRVRAVGICGTDYGGYRGTMPYFSYPRIPGHELGVEVEAVGEGVTHVRAGDRCCVEPYINCQECHACRRGLTNCCERHQTLGVHCDGGLRPAFLVPARKLHPSPRLAHEQNALVETLAIGCHAVARARVAAGETVLVVGAGPIGLSAIEFARLAGARVIVIDRVAARLEFVHARLGIPDTILAAGDEADGLALAAATGGRLAEVVVDATGSAGSMGGALRHCAFGGRMVWVGITQDAVAVPHVALAHRRELTILASRNAPSADFPRIIRLIEEGRIDTDPWITHRLPFADTIPAFPALLDPASGVVKAVVTVS